MTKKTDSRQECSAPECCPGISRRRFLATSGAAAALPIVAGPFSLKAQAQSAAPHLVPADKKLAPDWVAALTARGTEKIWSGDTLNTLALPIGGVGAGQMYLLGDGRLACWHIYNHTFFTGHGRTNYQQEEIPGLMLEQGFALTVKPRRGPTVTRRLDKSGFPNVGFIGRYPIGKVLYRDDSLPVAVELEAFSPFIPLNTLDSTLPATILDFSVKNTSDQAVEVDLTGWLENPVGVHSARAGTLGRRRQAVGRDSGAVWIDYSGLPVEETGRKPAKPPEVFADFEGQTYGGWTTEGAAFGQGPAGGAVGGQRPMTGFKGQGLVNTHNPDNDARGKLLSPEFTIRRPFINFLVGGGSNNQRVYMRLLVEDKEVRRSAGQNSEQLIWRSWNVKRFAGKKARIEIVDDATGNWGHITVDHIEFADAPRGGNGEFEKQTDFGTVRLALLAGDGSATADGGQEAPSDPSALLRSRKDEAVYELGEVRLGALGRKLRLAPGETASVPFVLAWHFPVRRWGFPEFGDVGNYYAVRFADAGAAVDYLRANFPRLCAETRLYAATFYDQSSLPHWLLERIGHTPSILATGTVHWRKNGRFWGWEGVGCCSGTCTHVWNYEHALARLLPELERSMREMQDFSAGLTGTGLVSFRGDSYVIPRYAADGQCGTVLKAYREHLVSRNADFLSRHYDKIKRILSYSMMRDADTRTDRSSSVTSVWPERTDPDRPFDGVLTDSQHNTYDINFHGPNTMIGSLYLAALLAGEQMALKMEDHEFAQLCRATYESGRKWTVENLFDGEYFFQDVNWEAHPQYQYGRGCLSDQLFGQGWARQLGLGDVYPREQVVSALSAIYKYNWTPDVGPFNARRRPERWFARAGDAGLFTCTWPKSEHPDDISGRRSVRYQNEVWTGIEYQVAGNMIYEGLSTEGLAIIRGVHDRHEGVKHNQYNEVECGDHYARAMAAWGCLLALCGFTYNGPEATLGFAPRVQEKDFACFFSAAEGWGTLAQKESGGKRTCTVQVAWGKLPLRRLELSGAGVAGGERAVVRGAERARIERDGDRLTVHLEGVTLTAGQRLEVDLPLV